MNQVSDISTHTDPANAPAPDGSTITVPREPEPPAPPKTYTEAELQAERKRIRDEFAAQQAEANKRMEAMQAEVAKLTEAQTAEEQRRQEEAQRLAAEEAARRAAEEENLSARELLERKEQEWTQRLNETAAQFEARVKAAEERAERTDAVLALERQFQELEKYRTDRLAEEADEIIPHLRNEVRGTTTEEIDQSIARMKGISSNILDEIAASQQQQRIAARGSQVTAPPIGPMDTGDSFETLTAEQIQGMTLEEYAKNRPRLLGAASQQRNQGMFGR